MMSAGTSSGGGVSSASKHNHPPFGLSFILELPLVVPTSPPPSISVSGGVNEGQQQITGT